MAISFGIYSPSDPVHLAFDGFSPGDLVFGDGDGGKFYA